MRAARFFFLFSALTLCFASVAHAQSSETGLPPFGSFQGSNFDLVSLKNGNLHVEIPLWSLPQRAAPNTGLRLVYDMPTWLVTKSHPTPTTTEWRVAPVNGEKVYWNYFSDPVHPAATQHDTITKTCFWFAPDGRQPFQYNVHVNYVMTDSHGTKHPFNLRHVDFQPTDRCTDPVPSTDTGFALDGSGYKATIAANNANSVQYQTAADVGQFNGNLGGELSTGGSTNIQTDANGVVLYRIDTVLDSNGNQQQFRVDYASVPSSTSFCALLPLQPLPSGTTCVESVFTLNLPQKLTLPNGKFYQFTWSQDGNADLLRIDLPTGGSISYGYGSKVSVAPFQQGGVNQYKARRMVTSRTVNDGVLPPQQWGYLPGGIVHDPLGNEEVHSFGVPSGGADGEGIYDVQVDYYQGTAASGKLFRTIKKDYLAETDPGLADSTPHGTINARLIRTTTILGDAAQTQTKTETDYETLTGTDGTTYTFLNPIEQREFAYGPGTPGALLRRTVFTYLHTGNQNYLSRNIVHRVLSTTVYDGSSHQVAQTVSEYDNYAHSGQPMLASNSIQHDPTYDTNFIYRGNVTAVSHWRNTDGAMLTSTNQYDDAGNLLSSIDPLGHKTSYDYTDSWGNGSCTPVGQAKVFATTITNALSQPITKSYNSCTATIASVTDLNAKTTTFSYDPMNRLKNVTKPDGGGTDNTYDDTQLLATSSTVITLPDSRIFSRQHYDHLGRVVQAELCEDGSSACATSSKTDTTFDGIGQISTVSNPYRTANDPGPTNGITRTDYDGLGRATQITRQDGSIGTISYDGNCTTAKDEAGNQRKSCSDALGRLVEVDEPGSAPPVQANYHALMQQDGNFVLLNSAGTSVWSTGTGATNAQTIFMQDDGNLVTYIFKWQAGVYAAASPGPFPSSSCSIGTYLVAGQMLPSGKCIVSPHGQYFLLMNTDGNFFIYDWAHGTGTWGPGTQGHPGAYAIFQTDGNLVVYSASGVALWSSGTSGTNAERMNLEDDGRIIIWKSAWNSGTSNGQFNGTTYAHPGYDAGIGTGTTGLLWSGQCFVSPNGRFELLMQADGNMVIYDRSVTPNAAIWSTGTAVSSGDPLMGLRTLYFYDALGNLYCVEQHGDAATGTACPATPPGPTDAPVAPDPNNAWRRRLFAYDSLSRLRWASNPESGVISYTYDNDSELLQKTSPLANQTGTATQTVSYCYDQLHRITGKGYGAQSCPLATPVVTYAYDSGANAKGHLTSLADQAGTATYTYDIMGRLATETRTIAGASKGTSYTYNLDGSVKTLTYPSGRVVTYTPDSAGRLISAVDGSGTNYVTSASYNPDGSLKGLLNGSTPALNSSFQYNPRLQLCRITTLTSGTLPTSCTDSQHIGNVMDRGYDYHLSSGDNGNVMAITNYRDTTRSQAFTYDALNRLTSAWSSANTGSYSWGENYSIDAWGNLQISPMGTKAHGGTFQLSGNAQNRPTGMNYDAAGNLLSYLTANYTYDQENRLLSTAGMTYIYDGNGERVLKSNTSTGVAVKRYWSVGGNTLAEGDGTGNLTAEYIYFGSKHIARIDLPANTVHYYLSDHLGSTSIVASAAGAIEEESDYYPFGTEVIVTGGANELKFTGKRRDTESQLDYFGARYYSNAFGRFTTADKPFADQHPPDPQSWNIYSYVRNNPLRLIDDTGQTAKPAESKFINDALATDPTLRNVILRSNNFSPGGFEDAYKSGSLSNLDTGVGNTLRGLAGEAQVINEINADAQNPGAAFAQPTNLQGVMPDIGWTLGLTPGAVLLNVATAGGGLTDVRFGPNLSTAYMEVKSGLSASSIPGGVTQAVNTVSAINKAGLGGSAVSVLIVDAGAWSALSAKQRAQLVNQAQSGGAYIQVQPGLADAARKRAQQLINEAHKKEQSH